MSFPSKLAIFGFVLFSFSISFAQAKDFVAMDSIGVQRVGDKTFIVHRIGEQETLFSISRRYKVSMGDIQGANEALKQGLKVGETILVPYGQVATPVSTATPAPAASPKASLPVAVASTPAATTTPVASTSPKGEAAAPVTVNKPAAPKTTTRTSTLTHKVKSGESLYVVAKKYNVSIKDLKTWNSLKADKVTVGQSLKIQRTEVVADTETSPTASTTSVASSTKKEEVKKEEKQPTKKEVVTADKKVASVATTSPASSTQPGEWISHTVKSGESLFVLSKQYGTSIEELIQWNALTSNNLKVGQSIKVGRTESSSVTIPTAGGTIPTAGESVPSGSGSKTQAPSSPQSTTSPTRSSRPAASTSSTSTSPAAERPSSATALTTTETTSAPNTSGGFSNNKETGLAELIPNTSGNKKYLVLHRTAPVGSVIRVKNEENDLTIFARVVGVLPETGDNAKLLIKLSQAAYDQLKAVNQRFPVEILY